MPRERNSPLRGELKAPERSLLTIPHLEEPIAPTTPGTHHHLSTFNPLL